MAEPVSTTALAQRCERLRKRYGAVVAQSPCFSIDEMEAALDHSRELGAENERLRHLVFALWWWAMWDREWSRTHTGAHGVGPIAAKIVQRVEAHWLRAKERIEVGCQAPFGSR